MIFKTKAYREIHKYSNEANYFKNIEEEKECYEKLKNPHLYGDDSGAEDAYLRLYQIASHTALINANQRTKQNQEDLLDLYFEMCKYIPKLIEDWDVNLSRFQSYLTVRIYNLSVNEWKKLQFSPLTPFTKRTGSYHEEYIEDVENGDEEILEHHTSTSASFYQDMQQIDTPEEAIIKKEIEQEKKDVKKKLYEILDKTLSELERDCFILHYVDGLKYTEISDKIGKTYSCIDNALQRARKRLEFKYGDLFYKGLCNRCLYKKQVKNGYCYNCNRIVQQGYREEYRNIKRYEK